MLLIIGLHFSKDIQLSASVGIYSFYFMGKFTHNLFLTFFDIQINEANSVVVV